MASTVAWIWAIGMLGSKIRTLGPRSGSAEEGTDRAAAAGAGAACAGAACAGPVADTVAPAVSKPSRRTRCRRLGVRWWTGDRDIVVTHLRQLKALSVRTQPLPDKAHKTAGMSRGRRGTRGCVHRSSGRLLVRGRGRSVTALVG